MKGLTHFLRDAAWLDGGRAFGWCVCLAVFSAIGVVASIVNAPHGFTAAGHLLGPDFVTFYGASTFLHDGQAPLAYDHAIFAARLQSLFPHQQPGDYAFIYPPTMLFLCMGVAALPYMAALCLWLFATLLALLAALRTLLPPRVGLLAALTYPGILINLANGQNAFATGACFAAAMACGDRAPVLAGICLGGLAIKPQLAVLIPVGLALAGKWRSFFATAATAIALCAASAAIFGAGIWPAWITASALSRTILEQGWNGYANMLSVFAAVRLLHGGIALAYLAQAAAAAAILALLATRLSRAATLPAAIAATIVATLLATPWSLDYDLAILAGPLAWMAALAVRTGWRPWEKITLLAAYLLPLLARNVAADLRLDVAPIVLLPLLVLMLRRAAADEGEERLGEMCHPPQTPRLRLRRNGE